MTDLKDSQNFYISSDSELRRLIEIIKETRLIAVDTEFTRRTTYYPILSIIQISLKNAKGQRHSFIIDCLAGLDLSDVFMIIADPQITKIFHSSAQDLQIFHQQLNDQFPSNVVDTQVMANFCGLGFNIGYSNLVQKLFQITLNKDQQNSDWHARPLNQKQIHYAFLDVVFLEEIHEKFLEILSERGRIEWFYEEMKSFVEKTLLQSDENLTKKFSFRNKKAKDIARITDLVLWRERWARKIDVPRQHLLKDEVIEKIVYRQSLDFNFGKNVSPKMLEEIKKILAQTNQDFEKVPRFFMNEKQKKSYQEAKRLISKISLKENFKEQFLITSSDLKKAICEEKFFNEKLVGWRHQLFGKELANLLSPSL